MSYPDKGEVRRLTPRECEGVMAFPKDWTKLREMRDSEETDTARYHALGNAVTPPVAEWLAVRIADLPRPPLIPVLETSRPKP